MNEPLELSDLVDRSRRLGMDQSLIVHGGGNTSAKGEITDFRGHRRRVMWVKGSGTDMAESSPSDYPALYLDDLDSLRRHETLTDEEMTGLVARCLADPGAPRPSIETLLHAFLPYTHIDHVHADAICALTNHAEGPAAAREALGGEFAYVDWRRPGFALSKIVGDLADYQGVVLAHHGLVTWANDSQTCYRRTIDTVHRAADYIHGRSAGAARKPFPSLPEEDLHHLLPELRGALATPSARRVLRVDSRLRGVADRGDVEVVAAAGVATADHMLRIKPFPVVVRSAAEARAVVEAYAHRYEEYFLRQRAATQPDVRMHDPMPRVILVPGVGVITTGWDEHEARVAADIAVHSQGVAAQVIDAFGAAVPLPEEEIFGIDYWPMELYKLSRRPPPPRFAGHIFAVTGAASGIGRTIALDLAGQGASLVLADIDGSGLAATAASVQGPEPALLVGDQSDEKVVRETVRAAVRRFGGLDGIVCGAGIALAAPLTELTLDGWRRSLDTNLTSAFLLTREALRVMREQGTGGSLVYVASKNAFGPGPGFAAYSASKAAMVQLCRVAALEGGEIGVRANAVNPDAVFDGSRLWSEEVRAERARAHGIEPGELEGFYARRNLLHRRVTTDDVARAVSFLLSEESSRTTGSVLPVDGGVATAFPR